MIFLLEEIQFDICQSCYEPRESSEKLKEAIAKFFGGASTSLMTVPKMPKAIEPANLILKDFESNTSNDLSRVHARQAKNALKSNKERKHARFIKAVRLK